MQRARLALSLFVFGGAAVFAALGAWPWPRLHQAEPIVVSRAWYHTADTLRQGETLTDLMARQGLGSFDVTRLRDELGMDLRRLRAGLVFLFRRASDEETPSQIVLRTGPEERVRMARGEDGWVLEREPIAWRSEVVRVAGDIGSSLYLALDEYIDEEVLSAGDRVRLAWDVADVYMWSVDFTRDIQPGDRFAVLIERQLSEEGEVRYGRVLAAGLEVGGRPLTAFRFEEEAENRFYDEQGKSLRRSFLRAPLQFRRISSSFSLRRFHPILQTYRRHAGTDYSAAAGTPVMAAGDGTVTRAGWAGGYGNLVEIRHRNGITTRYAHLRSPARGIRSGTRVHQGDVIGYVGSTGLATAAHLHYEFLVNGVQRDSRRIKLDDGPPVPEPLRAAFETQRDRLAALLGFEPRGILADARRAD